MLSSHRSAVADRMAGKEQKGDVARPDPPDVGSGSSEAAKEPFMQMAAAFFQQGGGSAINPEVASKVTSEHITQILKTQSDLNELQLEDRKGQRKQGVTLSIIGCAFLLLLVGLLVWTGNPALTEDVVKAIVFGGAGFAGGYGIGRRRD